MKLKNIQGLSAHDLQSEASNGARFVYFMFTLSFIIVSVKRNSGVYMIRPGEKSTFKSLPFTILSLLFGCWGIPYGPAYTLESIRTNSKGGKDVTEEVMATVAGHILFQESKMLKVPHS